MCLGIPGRITDIWDDRGTRMAIVDFGGVTKTVCLAYVPAATVGEYTIIHAGFALTRLDERAARETLAIFRDLGLLEEELGLTAPPGPPGPPAAAPEPGPGDAPPGGTPPGGAPAGGAPAGGAAR